MFLLVVERGEKGIYYTPLPIHVCLLCLCLSIPLSFHMHILSLELGVLGGLVTPACSYILSESILCHSTVV